MKNKRGRMLSAAAWVILIILTALLVKYKIDLTGTQMVEGYASGDAPIDDTLMYESAVSISKGEWLGPYNWKTLSKHMFFSVWLAWLSNAGISYLLGGQLLYLAGCIAAAWAVAPLFKVKQWCTAVFAVLWMSPYSWAQFTLRVYRDNIFPSLCLLFFAGMLGMALRFREKLVRSVGFAVLAGLGFGTSWLTREDGRWLLPFAGCAVAVYLILLALQKQFSLRQKLARAALPATALVVCLVCIGLYCEQNYQHYGRFVVSDFTSKEFEDAVGALLRCDTDGAHEKILVCKETRDKVAAVSPLYAELERVLAENPIYGGYGYPEKEEFNSGGFCWAFRTIVSEAGYYTDARTARDFYRALAAEINAACDSGEIEHNGGKKSTTLMPWHAEYMTPTLTEFENSVRCLLEFDQTSAFAQLSTTSFEQADEMMDFLHVKLSIVPSPEGNGAMYTFEQLDAGRLLYAYTKRYRSAIVPLLWTALFGLIGWFVRAGIEIRKKEIGMGAMSAIMLLGVVLSILLRIAIISYVEAVSFKIGTYLLYLSSAGPLILLFAAAGSACLVEMAIGGAAGLISRQRGKAKRNREKTA